MPYNTGPHGSCVMRALTIGQYVYLRCQLQSSLIHVPVVVVGSEPYNVLHKRQ